MSALTPEKLAELRRLLDANEVPSTPPASCCHEPRSRSWATHHHPLLNRTHYTSKDHSLMSGETSITLKEVDAGGAGNLPWVSADLVHPQRRTA